jgi:hypothetical protein
VLGVGDFATFVWRVWGMTANRTLLPFSNIDVCTYPILEKNEQYAPNYAQAGTTHFVSAINSSGNFSGSRWMLSTTVYCLPKMSLTYSSALASRLMQ